jgi:flagellar biosynthetic protein FliR
MATLILGMMIGLVAELVFAAVRMSGEYLAVQMGLSISGTLDPITGIQTPLVGQIFFIFAFFIFLNMNIHHALIVAVDKSFHWIPLGQGITEMGRLAERFIALSGDMFVLALLVGLPVMGVLLATEAAMAFIAKVMPQMNIFIVGLPLKSFIGLLVIFATMPLLADLLSDQYSLLVQHLMGLYRGV